MVEDQAASLPEDEHQKVLERLKLAREFVGTQNPLDFYLDWRTPLERYVPLALRNQGVDAHHEQQQRFLALYRSVWRNIA